MQKKLLSCSIFVLIITYLLSATLMAQRNRITKPIDNSRRVFLKGHLHPKAQAENDQGVVDPSLILPYVTVALKQTPQQEADLNQLLAEQQDPSSPNYHHWLSPEEYADRFGASPEDVNKLTGWLQAQNLTIAAVGRARTWIAFKGTAAAVQNAFGIEIHHFLVDGKLHFANTTEPSIPAAFEGVVGGIHGLNNFRYQPASRAIKKPDYTSGSGAHYLAPDDLATIYNMKPLYNGGIDGSGQKIVVAGQTQIDLADIRQFRSYFNLPANDPQVILVPNSQDPGTSSSDLSEADLDLEWSGAVARNANITYVYSNDVMTSAQYAIDQNLAPVLTISYGLCEAQTASVDATTTRSWAKQANAQGMTWFAASGDAGGADCTSAGGRALGGLAVDLPASLPEVTGVGGNEFNEGSGSFWNSAQDSNHASVLSYIPETAWNDDSSGVSPSASGGGASILFSKPAWQSGTGVPSDAARDVPDVSLSASADHDGYLIYTGGKLQVIGGTSVGSPSFAGIAALINHYLAANGMQTRAGLGNINPRLYTLAQTTPGAFHDITSGNNIINVTCSSRSRNCHAGSFGYSAGVGYDQVTGLGSVDAYNLAMAWSDQNTSARLGTVTVTVSASAATIASGDSTVLTAAVASANGSTPSGTVTFYLGGASLGAAALAGSGSTVTATWKIDSTQLNAGSNTITAQYSGDNAYNPASGSVTITLSSGASGPPVIAGLANGASFLHEFAPGMILSVFGSQLADSVASAPSVPLPNQLAGVSATVNGIPAPLYFASPGQLNLQVPYEIPSTGTAVLAVTRDGQRASASFNLSSAAPGIFVNQSGAPVPNTSAARGQVITLYITGYGAVSPAIATGAAPDPATALAALPKPQQKVTVQVAGIDAPIQFDGIPWGLAGAVQINYQVPAGVPLGNQSVVVIVGGVPSAAATLYVTQ